MKANDLVKRAEKELEEEMENLTVSKIKARLVEIRSCRSVLRKLEQQYETFLGEEIDPLLLGE